MQARGHFAERDTRGSAMRRGGRHRPNNPQAACPAALPRNAFAGEFFAQGKHFRKGEKYGNVVAVVLETSVPSPGGGAGADGMSLVLFDLSVLALTKLPALIHDAHLLRGIAEPQRARLMNAYASVADKQIFLATDGEER